MNYVVFFSDELRAEELACYGNPITKTSNYDRMAAEGVRFDQCHVQNPVCSPSRCCFFTGEYVHVNGHRSLWNLIKPGEKNLLSYLKKAGYETRIYGKNDLLSEEAKAECCDEFRDCGARKGDARALMKQYLDQLTSKPGEPGYYDFLMKPQPDCDDTKSGDGANVQAGMDFIRNRGEDDKPFFLFLPLLYPHPPYVAMEPWYGMYDPDEISLRPAGEGKPLAHRLIREYHGQPSDEKCRKINAVYKGMVSYTDMLLGRLMDCLKETGRDKDTMLIASADHGDYAGDYGLVEKWPDNFEDVLTRVPLLVRGPGCAAGHTVKEPVELFDIMATVMDLEKIRPEHTYFAKSFAPQLAGAAGDPDRAVFCEGGYNRNEPHVSEGDLRPSTEGMFRPENPYFAKIKQQHDHPDSVCRGTMIRTLKHKLILRDSGENEFYDLRRDPKELVNRYGDPEYTEAVMRLKERMLHWYLETSDIVPMEEDAR